MWQEGRMFVRETGKVFGIGYRLVRSDRKRRDCGMLLTRARLLLRCTREKRHAEKRCSNKRGEYKAHLVTPIRAGGAARIIVTFGRRRTFPLRLFPGESRVPGAHTPDHLESLRETGFFGTDRASRYGSSRVHRNAPYGATAPSSPLLTVCLQTGGEASGFAGTTQHNKDEKPLQNGLHRYRSGPVGTAPHAFQDRRIQPLCHLSKCPLTPILIAVSANGLAKRSALRPASATPQARRDERRARGPACLPRT